jgi:hypothetical protein
MASDLHADTRIILHLAVFGDPAPPQNLKGDVPSLHFGVR